jgi:segregation and condensation protein A
VTAVGELELDLEVFNGPFDLLLTLVLREEVDLLEIELAEIVLSYLDVLEARGELDLEATTDFLVLIAALLELKSRLMLPGDEEGLLDLEPGEAAEELLARLLDAMRYQGAAGFMQEQLESQDGVRFRSAPLPPPLDKISYDGAEAIYAPGALGKALGGLLQMPPRIDTRHLTIVRVTMAERLAHLRTLLSNGGTTFKEAIEGADRVTVCVTMFALLELYKSGEATWTQTTPFGEIAINPVDRMAIARGAP